APELRSGATAASPASDVYGLGAILFEILTLEPMHHREHLVAALLPDQRYAAEAASQRAPARRIAPELDAICAKAVAWDPAARFGSARELADVVGRFLDGQRDDALRTRLAGDHAERADRASRVASREPDVALAARRTAMREVGRALAFDPGQRRAHEVLARVLTEPPPSIPLEVRQRLRESAEQRWALLSRYGVWGYAAIVLYVPLLALSGVRDWTLVFVTPALALVASGLAFLVGRSTTHRHVWVWATFCVSNAAFAASGFLFGGLIVAPMTVTANAMSYVFALRGRARTIAALATVAFVVGPVVAQLAIGDAVTFQGDALVITARAIDLTGGLPPIIILLSFGGTLWITGASVAKSRAEFDAAEARLYLQDWHLRQLYASPGDSGGSDSIWRVPSGGATTAKPRGR
ncbi:MAG: hypothetical protein AAF721_41395, partial [Myxococcota bacterium]